MTDLFSLPEVQSALIPFLVALIIGMVAGRGGPIAAGVGGIAGFISAALLINGMQFQPLSAARKIILIGIGAAIIGAVLDMRGLATRPRNIIAVVAALAAAAWVFGIALMRLEGSMVYLAGLGIAGYVAWMIYALSALQDDGLRAVSAATALGLGTGVAAIIGSSALFGQLALAVGAASGAVALALLLLRKNTGGAILVLPAAVLATFIGCAVVAFAELNWYALVPMALVPLVARFVPVPATGSRWVQAAVIMISSIAVGGASAAIAWLSADSSMGGY